MKKILGICGDSFMSAVIKDEKNLNNGYGKHFTEILSKMLDCEIVTYARSAISNQVIRLQIDEIIKNKPTYIIIGTTTPDRIEIPLNDVTVKNYMDKWDIQQYKFSEGLYNIKYDNYKSQSYLNENFKDKTPTLISSTITHLIDEKSKLNEDMLNAVINYFQFIYDMSWKRQMDTWIISDGVQKLLRLNLDFSLITPQIESECFSYCLDKIIPVNHPLNPWTYYNPNVVCNYPFHISEEDSIFLAKLWYEKLKDKFI